LGLNEGVGKTENWPYLRNSERYGQGCYESLVGSGIRPFRLRENH